MKVIFENGENYNIKTEDIVKVIKFNDESIKVKSTSRRPQNLNNYRKISKDEYVDITTGEVRRYKKRKYKDKESIRRATSNLKEILRNNFNGGKNELFITLTCEELTEDYDVARKFCDNFFKDLRNKYEGLEYVYVLELQKRKSWHIHAWIKSTKRKILYIDNEEIAKIWNKGFAKTQRITKEEFGDKDTAETDVVDIVINYMTKIKSKDRIETNKKLYYKSRGIKLAKVDKMKYKQFVDTVELDYILEEEKTLLVKSVDGSIISKHKTEVWKQIKKGDKQYEEE